MPARRVNHFRRSLNPFGPGAGRSSLNHPCPVNRRFRDLRRRAGSETSRSGRRPGRLRRPDHPLAPVGAVAAPAAPRRRASVACAAPGAPPRKLGRGFEEVPIWRAPEAPRGGFAARQRGTTPPGACGAPPGLENCRPRNRNNGMRAVSRMRRGRPARPRRARDRRPPRTPSSVRRADAPYGTGMRCREPGPAPRLLGTAAASTPASAPGRPSNRPRRAPRGRRSTGGGATWRRSTAWA